TDVCAASSCVGSAVVPSSCSSLNRNAIRSCALLSDRDRTAGYDPNASTGVPELFPYGKRFEVVDAAGSGDLAESLGNALVTLLELVSRFDQLRWRRVIDIRKHRVEATLVSVYAGPSGGGLVVEMIGVHRHEPRADRIARVPGACRRVCEFDVVRITFRLCGRRRWRRLLGWRRWWLFLRRWRWRY